MTGKEKCKLLRQIRKEIAEANDIVFLSADCKNEECHTATCPLCDAEIQWLDAELARKAATGKRITLKGLSLDTFNDSACSKDNDVESLTNKECLPDFSVGGLSVMPPRHTDATTVDEYIVECQERREQAKTRQKRSLAELDFNLAFLSVVKAHERKFCSPVATKSDWHTEPAPEKSESFILHMPLNREELLSLSYGFVPWNMDQKWFYYYDDGKLYFYRSWTGYLYYVVTLDFTDFKHSVLVYLHGDNAAEELDMAKSCLGDLLQKFARTNLYKLKNTEYQYRMFDIHSHILPQLDDGAVDFDMALSMIRKSYKQGVRNIVCSSHSWGEIQNYKQQFALLKERVEQENIHVKLHQGCEIACSEKYLPGILRKLKSGLLPTMCGSKYIMLEFLPSVSSIEIQRCIRQITDLTDYRIIIAHIERYESLSRDISALKNLKQWGCWFQINAYSLAEETKESVREFARILLKAKQVDVLGSDAHRTDHRAPAVEAGIDYIYKNCDDDYAQNVCYRNAEKLLAK